MRDAEHFSRIIEFVRGVGIAVEVGPFGRDGFLPGIRIRGAGMTVDPEHVDGAGDILHEAGHIAVVPSRWRGHLDHCTDRSLEAAVAATGLGPEDWGVELTAAIRSGETMAVAWSWAALHALDLDPEVVFFEGGYQSDANGWFGVIPGFKADTKTPAIWRMVRDGMVYSLRSGKYRAGIIPMVRTGMTGRPPALAEEVEDNGLPAYPAMGRWLQA